MTCIGPAPQPCEAYRDGVTCVTVMCVPCRNYIAPFVTDVRVLPDIALNEKAVRHIYEGEFDRLIAYVETWVDGGNEDGFADVLRRQRDRNTALIEALKKALGHLDMISPSGWHVEQARSTIIKVLEDAGS